MAIVGFFVLSHLIVSSNQWRLKLDEYSIESTTKIILPYSKTPLHLNVSIAEIPAISARIVPSEKQRNETTDKSRDVISENIHRGQFFPDVSFDTLVNNYIRFHKSAIEDGKLKDGFRYVVYTCSNKSKETWVKKCGGVGDRVLGMVKAFYFAMITRRVLLIDSEFPVPLKNYLNPSFVRWDAEFPMTKKTIDGLRNDLPIGYNKDIRGYYLLKCNGWGTKKLTDILSSKLMRALERKNGRIKLYSEDNSRAFHQAFWALFKFDDAVLSRADEMKEDAGLAFGRNNISAPIQERRKKEIAYVGLHSRQSDASIPGVRLKLDTIVTKHRITGTGDLLKCYSTFRRQFPGEYQAAYIASNDYNIKKLMKGKETTIHYPPKVKIFHVDLSTREEAGNPRMSKDKVHNGFLDTLAELAVLVDSSCLIMSKSMFSILAYYIRDDTTCNVYIPDCNDATVAQRFNKYTMDPQHLIYSKWS